MFGLDLATLWHRLVYVAIVYAVAFSSGYALRWHQDSLVEVKKATITKTVTVVQQSVLKVTDEAAVNRLKNQLANSNNQAASLQRQIEELSHAKPADPVCRLPDGLRNELNATFTTGQGGTADTVRRQDRGSPDDS